MFRGMPVHFYDTCMDELRDKSVQAFKVVVFLKKPQ